MARPSGQKTMKPSTIRPMVAGVQAGRISALVFIFSRSFSWTANLCGCTESKWRREFRDSRLVRPKPDKPLKMFRQIETPTCRSLRRRLQPLQRQHGRIAAPGLAEFVRRLGFRSGISLGLGGLFEAEQGPGAAACA